MTWYTQSTPAVFFILTVVIGGGAAFLAGRGLAIKWRPLWQLVMYMLILGVGVRFLHFALFQEGFMTPSWYYLVDTTVLMIAALLGYRLTRVKQMTTQYHWLYERSGPLSWRKRA